MQKEFGLAAVLSVTTGKMFCDYNEIDELLKFVNGSTVHECHRGVVWPTIAEKILKEHPNLPTASSLFIRHVDDENRDKVLELLEQTYGKKLAVTGCIEIGHPREVSLR